MRSFCDRPATIGFIIKAPVPARLPICMPYIWRNMLVGRRPAIGGPISLPFSPAPRQVSQAGREPPLPLASAAAVAIVLLSPQWLAPLIPDSVDEKLGDALVGDFGGRFCSTPAGDAALKKLVASLDANPGDLQVEVAKIDMVNAVALPGGKVILFDGLVKQARSPDEVAGVLAHEIGHVRERHVMQGLLRQMGLAVVLGGFDGSGGSTLNSLLSTTYTRDSEREADDHSLKALKKANEARIVNMLMIRFMNQMIIYYLKML